MFQEKSFQEYYAPEFSHCFGCGTQNPNGLHVKSYWSATDSSCAVAHFTPQPQHTGGYPGFVYGGLIAALLDCHGNGTAAAAAYRRQNRPMDSLPALRYVTAHLELNYKKPTPMGVELELSATVIEITDRKVVMQLALRAEGITTVDGLMVAVQLPQTPHRD